MPTLLRYRPPVPVRTKPLPITAKPSLIDWPIVTAVGACAVVFLAGVLTTAWFASRAPSALKDRPAPVALAPVQEAPPPVQAPVDGPPVALPPEPLKIAAKELEARPKPSEPKPAEPEPLSSATPPACETFGTQVQFVGNPADAARLARQENKLMFVLHLSGNFEDDKFT